MYYCMGITKDQCELMKAIDRSDFEKAKNLVAKGVKPFFKTLDSIIDTPLSLAAHKGNLEMVKWLVEVCGVQYDEDFVSFIASTGQIEITLYLAHRIKKK